MKRLLLSFFVVSGLFFTTFAQPELSTRMQRALQNTSSDEYVKGIIFLRDQVDVMKLDAELYKRKATPSERSEAVITALETKATSTQRNLIKFLQARTGDRSVFNFTQYWIVNAIAVEAKKSVFEELQGSIELVAIDLDAPTYLDAPVAVRGSTEPEGKESVEQGLKVINAHLLWQMGITGQGTLVMGEDTGVRHTHVAIAARWRGNFVPANQAWLDPAGGTTTPSDCDGHGTHTVGTMVGRSATGDTVGVAPDAQWIAAKTICSGNSTSNHLAAFQWATNPDGNPATTTDMPISINNSWYDPETVNQCAGQYVQLFNAVEATGIAICFSAGNSGPNPSTITMPKNINTNEVNVFAMAAIDGAAFAGGNNNPIASFSSRGPSSCGGTGALLIKPEVSAPGVNVRSAYGSGDNSYSSLDGTSMASPHVAGAIALLKQAFPSLTGHQLKMALYETARDLGTAGEDNNYGRGLIDVFAAYSLLATGPGFPNNPVPENGAAGIQLNPSPTVAWSNPDSTTKTTVYFSTDMQSVAAMSPAAIVRAGALYTSYTHGSTLAYGTTYYWRVNVVNAASDSTIGGVWSFTTIPPPAPVAPTNVVASWSGANNQVTVNWTVPTTNVNGHAITVDSSVVWMNGTERLGSVAGTTGSFVTDGLTTGIHYFSVIAFDSSYGSAEGVSSPTGIGIYANVYARNKYVAIRDNQSAVDTVMVPTLEANIVKVIVKLDNIQHTYTGDLDIFIKGPNGTEVELSSDNGAGGDNYIGTIFDDAATTLITAGTAPFTGTYKPEGLLSTFANIESGGAWILRVFDDAGSDTGSVRGWSLTLITGAPIPVELSSFNATSNGNAVELGWITATETNNLGFEVERKSGNGNFSKVGFVSGKGTTTESNSYTFIDKELAAANYTYRLKQIDLNGASNFSNEIEVNVEMPSEFGISQNYPNPFNPSTVINFALPVEAKVTLKVFDAIGQEVVTLVNGNTAAGNHSVSFDASKLNSGLYIYTINAESVSGQKFSKTMKMMLLK
ncbi:MAG: S8 family serine peptidase [Ignavibacteriaceae bacterium]|nr:S8 family serine peptidase [Ignavibacteriaceae bacterium]